MIGAILSFRSLTVAARLIGSAARLIGSLTVAARKVDAQLQTNEPSRDRQGADEENS